MLKKFCVMTIGLWFFGCSGSDGVQIPIFGDTSSTQTNKKNQRTAINSEDLEKPTEIEDLKKEGKVDYSNIKTDKWHPALRLKTSEGAPQGHLVCAKGPEALKFTDYDDFSDVFQVICTKDAPNQNFYQLLQDAFQGNNEPVITEFRRNINELYVTDFIYAFAVKVPVDSPAKLAGYPIYEEVSKSLKTDDSELRIKQVKEESFPGLGVVRSIEQDYYMPYAKGAGLSDTRKTLTNTYLIVEGTNDVNFSAEHLLQADKNDFYNASRQIVFGIKGDTPNSTYLIYVTQLVVINRFDPERLTAAAKDLAAIIPKVVLRTVSNKSKVTK